MTQGFPGLLALLPGNPAIVHPVVALTLTAILFLIADGIAHIAAPRLRRRVRVEPRVAAVPRVRHHHPLPPARPA